MKFYVDFGWRGSVGCTSFLLESAVVAILQNRSNPVQFYAILYQFLDRTILP